MKFCFVTLFPEHLERFLKKGIFQKAIEKGLLEIQTIDLRNFGVGRYKQVDDYPFSEKKGMILKPDVIYDAITSIDHYQDYRLLYTCPKGPLHTQERAKNYQKDKGLIFLSGFYEGIDHRIFDVLNIERVSVGEFIVSSGDIPAMLVADSVIRLIPGVLGNEDCIVEESYEGGLLEHPQYTKPKIWKKISVPDIVTSGHHQNIKRWQREKRLNTTLFKRAKLLCEATIDNSDKEYLTKVLEKGEKDVLTNY